MRKTKPKKKSKAEVPAKLSNVQEEQITEYLDKSNKLPDPLEFTKGPAGAFKIVGLNKKDERSRTDRFSTLHQTTGMLHPDSSVDLLSQVALSRGHQGDDKIMAALQEASTLMLELQPRDACEGLLVSQMVTCQNQVMSCLRQAEKAKFIDHRELHLRFADRFMKTFTKQMETLAKYRRGGQQKVVVEHVNVNEGGQAIIGSVSNQGGGQDAEK